ncbi:MAG: mannose-1-phosphate guanylyltransferase [Ignavibacteria bacterium]|nr:mannose-1-phosphate guanylyltransferase [Ignavibacteria bacterium]
MKRVALIMAGGSGERFWPLSRRKKPKQLLKLVSDNKTMLEESVERVAPLIDKRDVYIITSELLAPIMRNMLTDFPPENIIPEPYKRNTAPCLALGAAVLLAKYSNEPDLSVAVLTADQHIFPSHSFIETVDEAMKYAEAEGKILTIGIPPTRPETGYGYIELGEKVTNWQLIFDVLSFREKPSTEAAAHYLASGNFLWNSGMFFYKLSTFVCELKQHLPEVGNHIELMAKNLVSSINTPSNSLLNEIGDIFKEFPNISIDYGLMEKTANVAVARALFNWDDVGALDALRRTRPADSSGNISIGRASLVATDNSIIINESKMAVVSVLGMDGVAVVVTDDAVLVCPVDKVQQVRQSVEDVKNKFGEEYI